MVCPHDDGDDCKCRKPKPGMLVEAARRRSTDLSASFMVGDRWRDVEAGKAPAAGPSSLIEATLNAARTDKIKPSATLPRPQLDP